jgi:3-deoxy-7-phosphoheptulonate synthase
MILYISTEATMADLRALQERLRFMGLETQVDTQDNQFVLLITHHISPNIALSEFTALPFIEKVLPFTDQFKLAGKTVKKAPSIIQVGNLAIGGNQFIVMAGPCAIESHTQIFEIAQAVKQAGAHILRGGAFKPRTSPYDFQGLGEKGLKSMREAADEYGLYCVSEVMSIEDIPLLEKYVDLLQIGSRNMQNFSLLKALGKTKKPILLKRGLSATYKEFLSAAEYIMHAGNQQVILCERGIRTFETYTRNTLDLAAVPILKELTHLPIIVDPSHGVGLRAIVPTMAKAAIAVGADGLIVEVHTHPDQSISDASQTISPENFSHMMQTIDKIGKVLGKPVCNYCA